MPDFPNEDALQGCERDGDSFGWPVVAPRGRKITGATFCFRWTHGVGPGWFEQEGIPDGEHHCSFIIDAAGFNTGDPITKMRPAGKRRIQITIDRSFDNRIQLEQPNWTFDPPVDVVVFAMAPLSTRGIPVPSMPTVALTLEGDDRIVSRSPFRSR